MATSTNDSRSREAHEREAALIVARQHREWIFLWDTDENAPTFDFEERFADYYEFDDPHGEVILFDDFDPERRVLRSAVAFGNTFGPAFDQMRKAEHAIEEAPEVLISGDLAASRMVFIARLTNGAGEIVGTRAINSQVWRRSDAGRWRIVRDQTAVESIPVEAADHAMATLPRA